MIVYEDRLMLREGVSRLRAAFCVIVRYTSNCNSGISIPQ